jgi:hypothetical protein
VIHERGKAVTKKQNIEHSHEKDEHVNMYLKTKCRGKYSDLRGKNKKIGVIHDDEFRDIILFSRGRGR